MAKRSRSTPPAVLFLFIAALSLLVGTAGAVPEAAFTSNVISGAAPLTVQFNDTSTGAPTGWAWYFGDETYNSTPWIEQTDPAGWNGRIGHTSVVMPNGSIVLMGGVDAAYDTKNDTWLSTDNGTTWTCVNASSGWTAGEGHASVAMPDGSIVIMGGFASSGGKMNDTWRSDDYGATWTCVNASSGWTARNRHTSVAMPDGSIILMGGDDGGYRNDVWRSTDNGTTWTNQTAVSGVAPGWTARSRHTSVAMPDGSIVIMGGGDKDVWRSTDNGATWAQLPDAEWSKRQSHSSVTMPDGSIILMGGFGGDSTPYGNMHDIWRSTDNGTTWTCVNASAGWSARYEHTSVAMPDGSIIIMGGWDGVRKNDVWRLDTAGSNARNPTYTYTTPGTYTVALQAYNEDGYNATRKVGYITVTAPVAPTAAFTANRTTGTAPLAVQFNDTSTGGPTSWTWDFGDGTTSTDQNPTHTYAAGTYTVNLTVGNAAGPDTETRTDYITVSPAPTPTATATVTPTSRPVYSGGGGGGGSTAGPDGSYNVGGDSAVSKVNVTGTGLKTFIVTGRVQSSPGTGIPPAPGTPYQYIDLVPARFEEITGANITFTVLAAWLAEHGFAPGEVVMHRYNGTAWESLPTWVVDDSGTTVTFRAATPGFSLSAITGIRGESAVTTSTAAETAAPITAQPTATETTVAPAGQPAPGFSFGTAALAFGAVLALVAVGHRVRRRRAGR
ncbi:MAG TPA: PKD domain-containing protein [Methanoculleus sp.]|nr:PKD domain-containing protein [Methanoculleus sp.]